MGEIGLPAGRYSRYGMYWRLMGDVESRDYEAACFKEKEYARRAVDSVIPGDSESEEVHQLTGEDHLDGAQKSLDDISVGEIMCDACTSLVGMLVIFWK